VKKHLLGTICLSVVLGLAATAAQAEQVKLGIAAEPYPPFTSPDASGNWQGWEIDFAKAVCEEAELDCVVTPVAWDGIIPALTSNKIDMIVGSMSITPERQQTIDFSDKYYNTPTIVIGAKDLEFEATPEGLSDKTLGVQVATIHQVYANKHFAPAGATIREYQTQDEANNDLAAGRLDAVQADSIALKAFLKTEAGQACCEEKGVVAADVEVLGPGVGIGLRKGDTELKEKLNAAIKEVRANGTYAEISKKYFDFDPWGN
jgi:polar amino acid transport system substrate-binding protein